ncbi:MAG: glycosyltransferase [Flavobacteriales bacterium]|jgi:sugar transferase (PEP-CTERM/EpsH1 system associated)|nr:glycosyltransferase [Flavobacteriales bacterium]MCB0757323.1 glycosyltransferase [Flavobacteriales bacterium]
MKLLVVLSRMPYPLEKGDKLRAYHLVKRLARRHEVHLFCLSDQPIKPSDEDHLRSFCKHLQVVHIPRWRILLRMVTALFSRLPFQVSYFHHRHAQRAIDRVIATFRPDHVLCQLVRTTEYVRHRYELGKTLDYMDTLSKGMERRAENASFPLRIFLNAETRRLIGYENLMFDLFDNQVIISAQDRDLLYHPLRDEVAVVPNGVDTEYFTPRETEKTHDLLFTGNMNYPPNIDSVLFLVHRVLPLVHAQRPGTSLLIAGVDPDQRVRELATRDPHVTVSGWVKDIRDSYASARIFVAPMQIGTGLQNKLLEAMAMGMPCVTSDLANNAVGAEPNEAILIGHEPEEYAAHILHLLDHAEERGRLAHNALRFVHHAFDWDRSAERLERLMFPGAVGDVR